MYTHSNADVQVRAPFQVTCKMKFGGKGLTKVSRASCDLLSTFIHLYFGCKFRACHANIIILLFELCIFIEAVVQTLVYSALFSPDSFYTFRKFDQAELPLFKQTGNASKRFAVLWHLLENLTAFADAERGGNCSYIVELQEEQR